MDMAEENATQEEEESVRDDYRDDDGLLVCGRCGKRKELRLPMLEGMKKPMVVSVMCDCEKNREAEEARREAERVAEEKAARRRVECFPSSGLYRDFTFAADDGRSPRQSSVCKRFADTFDVGDPNGLVLWGGVGTGKSFMSSCIANEVISLGHSAYQTDISSVANLMESSLSDRNGNLDRILSYDLLLIEDLGAHRSTDYMMEYVYSIIDGRYKTGKPMVITTNFTLQEMSHASPTNLWCRIFDRILERCYPVEFDAQDRRKENANKMRERMRKRLGLD